MRASPASLPNGSTPKPTPDNPLELAADKLRVREAIQAQEQIKARKYLDALRDAETTAAYGDTFKPPTGDDMIAVDSNFKTEHHYHAPPTQPKTGMPTWAKAAIAAAAVMAAGGGGAWWASQQPKGPANAPAGQPDPSKGYQLDFWQP